MADYNLIYRIVHLKPWAMGEARDMHSFIWSGTGFSAQTLTRRQPFWNTESEDVILYGPFQFRPTSIRVGCSTEAFDGSGSKNEMGYYTIYINKRDTAGNVTTIYKVNMAFNNGPVCIPDADIPWLDVGAEEYIELSLYMYYLVDSATAQGLRKHYFLTLDIETLTRK